MSESPSFNPDTAFQKPRQNPLTIHTVQDTSSNREVPFLKLTPEIEWKIAGNSSELARGLQETMKPSEFDKFIKTLKENVPPELTKFVESLTIADIANMIAIVLMVALLLSSGVGTPVAIGIVSSRIGAQAIIMRIATAIVSRPNITSAVMGLVPGMKNFAPNQWIAFATSEAKNLFLYVIPAFATTLFAKNQK